ncbi:hypothetical protein SJA_C1-03440 [Sphingobium indicum UT26S]|uniref:Uncharacterized protein n=1 Tax=Sphingobium indicum (strain DSM 16413 / CCM 7287 / MTCC 6362 / UT26 / NBRC 101211 / UT26S) TaxID=452662 RepID=D4YXU6_SPHIU|nr:hypothetical protein SJA_C1-03440 [Sphingobium indicum UT26S]
MATVTDHLFDMGWGWDARIIWTAPIIVAGAVSVRLIGLAICRAVGAIPHK